MSRHRAILTAIVLAGCAAKEGEMKTVDYVDIDRFMGAWYVIGNIPTFVEKDIYNAVETYSLNDDGTIDTVFTFRRGCFDGKEKEYNPKGFVLDKQTNARWGMQFIWPVKSDYRIVYLDDEYTTTIIGRKKRDYVWIMARTPAIDEVEYARLVAMVEELGYDLSSLRRVPQQW